jgi:hypothetical protein
VPDEAYPWFPLAVLVLGLFGMVNALIVIRRTPGDTFSLGPIRLDKERATLFVIVANLVGLPLIAMLLLIAR